jgi:TolA-binding protein
MANLGQTAEARDAFVAVADRWRYPFGALWDDALWCASELDEKLGRYPEAIADLERMLKERETTTLMGSYIRPRMSPALLRIGALYAGRLHDHAKAREAFHRLYTDFTTSPLRPAALWREARLWAADGDASKACDRLATLVHDYPDGRYVPCATEQCKDVKRPEKSKAPTSCHPYLLREAEKPSDSADNAK